MESSRAKREKSRDRRAFRVRKKIRGTDTRPRLTVSKTNRHVYAQLIDDSAGITLAGVGTLSKENKGSSNARKSKESAKNIGKQIAEMAKKKNIEAVVFDRGRFKYHGVIAELAEGAREAGLRF